MLAEATISTPYFISLTWVLINILKALIQVFSSCVNPIFESLDLNSTSLMLNNLILTSGKAVNKSPRAILFFKKQSNGSRI